MATKTSIAAASEKAGVGVATTPTRTNTTTTTSNRVAVGGGNDRNGNTNNNYDDNSANEIFPGIKVPKFLRKEGRAAAVKLLEGALFPGFEQHTPPPSRPTTNQQQQKQQQPQSQQEGANGVGVGGKPPKAPPVLNIKPSSVPISTNSPPQSTTPSTTPAGRGGTSSANTVDSNSEESKLDSITIGCCDGGSASSYPTISDRLSVISRASKTGTATGVGGGASSTATSATIRIELPPDVENLHHHFRAPSPSTNGGGSAASKIHQLLQAEQLSVSEAEWELLSDRISACSGGGNHANVSLVVSARASPSSINHGNNNTTNGAVAISFNSSLLEQHNLSNQNGGRNNGKPVPDGMLLRRIPSSSTIDSQENMTLGPSGKGVLGVDYVEHVIQPTDTLQGICIAYQTTASRLQRANHFTGHSLHSAPKKLLIPLSKKALATGFIRMKDTDSKEYKLNSLLSQYPELPETEAKMYLELSNWDLADALDTAKQDVEWANGEIDEQQVNEALKAGQISIKVFDCSKETGKANDGSSTKEIRLKMKGTGHNHQSSSRKQQQYQEEEEAKVSDADDDAEEHDDKKGTTTPTKVKVYKKPPAIATNSIIAEDIYNAAYEHQSFGLELKPLSKKTSD